MNRIGSIRTAKKNGSGWCPFYFEAVSVFKGLCKNLTLTRDEGGDASEKNYKSRKGMMIALK